MSFAAACAASPLASVAVAQDATTEKAIEKYRADAEGGSVEQSRACSTSIAARRCGRRRAARRTSSLEQCDLGKGPGKVDGAFAELPRYFADADRVMDLETRLLWCMEKLQGFNRADLVKRPHPGGGQPVKELGAMATYVASKSSGRSSPRRSSTPREATRSRSARRCSSAAPARSISPARPATPSPACASACRACRTSPSTEEARKVIGEWPAYRVSTTHVMTMQHRLYDCYWQMRMPELSSARTRASR